MNIILSATEIDTLNRMKELVSLPKPLLEAIEEYKESESNWRTYYDMLSRQIRFVCKQKKVGREKLVEIQSLLLNSTNNVRVLMHGHTDTLMKVIEASNTIGQKIEFMYDYPEHKMVTAYLEEIELADKMILNKVNDFLEVQST